MNEQPSVQINNAPTADHDLLIRLDTKFDIFGKKLDDMSVNLNDRVDILEKAAITSNDFHTNIAKALKEEIDERQKADAVLQGAHDKTTATTSFLLKWFWIATGVLGMAEIIIAVWFVIHYGASPF